MGEETAHHVIAEKLIFVPDFSTCLGCSQSCILKDYNFSLLLELTSFFGHFFPLWHICLVHSSLMNDLKVLTLTKLT